MQVSRVEIVYPFPRSRLEEESYPERFIPKTIRLIDDEGNAFELPGVRQASISFGLSDARVLNVSLIVRAVDEVFEPEPEKVVAP